ncbi:MAG: hypothetical protein J6A75_13585 [Lachnospiraceae bacterium]|nr:hypothetical protein [Lachnospiraceae bacterium]
MIVVKIHDKRCINKYRIEFFDTEIVTEEIINFVRSNEKVFRIMLFDKIYDREEFLNQFSQTTCSEESEKIQVKP